MDKKIKIVIVGIGGVGGYFGGLLAKKYEESKEVEIVFVARGKHLKSIQANGLRVIKGEQEFRATPSLATDDPSHIGIADFILLCTKSYDLEKSLELLKPCIGSGTILLPLLNGVDSVERIQAILPTLTVLQGCVYIVSRLKEPGVVENSGNIQQLYFGLDKQPTDNLVLLETLLKNANIEATLSKSMSTIVWEKFIFISPMATATSYFDCSIGKVVAEEQETLLQLIQEVKQVAFAKGIALEKDIASKTLDKLTSMPYPITSSMHSDFQNRKPQTELYSLTGYAVEEGKKLGVQTPTYERIYKALLKRNPGS